MDINLDILNTAEEVIISGLRKGQCFHCFLCKGDIRNGAKVFSIENSKDIDGPYFYEYVHKKCYTTHMVALKLTQ